ncbi:hypothetical protein AXF42_Ash001178 [Apostasia shenzhenica]|uniref:Uncharacterized protein n=1 Tax=Apostasia shenzhenica TaxID=1088818 RepID=A0A2I0AU66_9ASPA|nr:hypothetical protein AXF42_Ash001178 [Apostasia shenzhenica]
MVRSYSTKSSSQTKSFPSQKCQKKWKRKTTLTIALTIASSFIRLKNVLFTKIGWRIGIIKVKSHFRSECQ